MKHKSFIIFIFALLLGACGPAMEPGDGWLKPLNSGDNSENDGGDLNDLFDAQGDQQKKSEMDQEEGSSDGFGPSSGEAPLIENGALPVQSEPVTGPSPVDMQAEEAAARQNNNPPVSNIPTVGDPNAEIGGAAGAEDSSSSNSGADTADADSSSGESTASNFGETAHNASADSAEADVPGNSVGSSADDNSPDTSDGASAESNDTSDQSPVSDSDTAASDDPPTSGVSFSNPNAARVYELTLANASVPFRLTDTLKRFWDRFDAFLENNYSHQVTPEEREVLKIPRCSGSYGQPLTSRWPNYNPHLAAPPIVPVFVDGIGVVDINAPLALFERERMSLSRQESFPFPYYTLLEQDHYRPAGADAILDHSVDIRGDLSFLVVSAAREIFTKSLSHAAQLTADSMESFEISADCLSNSSANNLCPDYEQAFSIHRRALGLQRLALALTSAEKMENCQGELSAEGSIEQLSESCLYNENLSHDPEIWGLKTFYNPFKNLTRRSSDIDHWGAPEQLTPSEADALKALLISALEPLPAANRAERLSELRHQALNVYRNVTLLFPSLRYVQSAELDKSSYLQALEKVSADLYRYSEKGSGLLYENLKNLRLFSLAMMSRLETTAPVEVCDITEEVISSWQPKASLASHLALDMSFHMLPLEYHKVIPLQLLTYDTFEGQGWEYLGQTLYDFAEVRSWAFMFPTQDNTLQVKAPEIMEAADAALRTMGLTPADQAPNWLNSSAQDIFKSLLNRQP